LAVSDDHVLRAVVEANFRAIFVSLHGDPDDGDNREIRKRAEALALRRPEKKPLEVYFYAADSASVWN
jgi:hypothetical protein